MCIILIVVAFFVMTSTNLSDLNPGDYVAFQSGSYYSISWQQVTVLRVTEQYIVLKEHPDIKFRKVDGEATGKGSNKPRIVRITAEIQEHWDKLLYKDKLQEPLVLTDNVDTDELIARVFYLLATQNKWEQREYRTAIHDILLKLKHLSSNSLKQAVALLLETNLPPEK